MKRLGEVESKLIETGMLDHLLEGCQLIGRDFRYIYVNEAAAGHGRTTPAALIGRTMVECYPGIDQTPMYGEIERCMKEREPSRLTNEFEFPDGSKGWFELRIEPVPNGVFILSIDVTEAHVGSAALARADRALRALSLCNQTLVRATNQRRFVDDVCKIVVRQAGYSLAWVGLSQADGTTHWACSEGPSAPHPSESEALARHIAAALAGEGSVVHEPLDDERWPAGTEAGLQSAVILPIRAVGHVLGVFVLCSADPEAFDEEERALVAEIAGDLGFGLHTLRSEQRFVRERESHHETQRELATLLANLPGMVYRCRNDRQWTMEVVSAGCAALTGYSQEELLDPARGGFAELVLEEDVEAVHAEVQASIREDRPFVCEYQICTAGGELKWVWERGVAVRDEAGEVVALEGFISDVTTRKRGALEVQDLNRRLRELADTVRSTVGAEGADAMAALLSAAIGGLLNCDGGALVLARADVNKYTAAIGEDELTNLSLVEGASIGGWVIAESQPVVLEDIWAEHDYPMMTDVPRTVRGVAVLPVGDPAVAAVVAMWSEVHTATDEELAILRVLADAVAIGLENTRAFNELARREALLESIQRHLPSALLVWRVDDGGPVLDDINAAAVAMNPHIEDAVGQGPELLRESFPEIEGHLQRCVTQQRILLAAVETDEDPPRSLEMAFAFVPPDRVIMRVDDVTTSREIERRSQASQRLEAVGQLAAGVAHDFNNLLTVINSYTELSLDHIAGMDPTESFLKEVLDAGQRAAALTAQLLAYSRRQMLAPEALSVNAVVENTDAMLRRLLSEDIEIMVRLAEDIGTVSVDPAQLEQVIVSLAINGRDAMPDGGLLTVETTNTTLDDDYAGGREDIAPGEYVVLSVTDTGLGMSRETLDRIFEPFFTTKEVGRGTGLGLATVHGIVTQSGGHVRVYSEPQSGTTFKVYLPRVDAPISEPHGPSEGEVDGVEVLLVAEDEPALRGLLERVLSQAGYAVHSAANGADALELARELDLRFDLLVTDVVMPRMSGRQLADAMLERQPDLKVLYTSGYTDSAIVHRGVLDEGTQFLGKPFSARDLLRKVRDVLDR